MEELASGSEVEVRRRVHPCPGIPQSGDVKLPYGMVLNDRLLHISEVEKGLACGCVCPSCRGNLIANKGSIKTHHFAHHSDRACVAAYETMLHKLAKQVIEDQKQVKLPPVVAKYKGRTEEIYGDKMFKLDEVVLEPYLGGVRPDILGRRRVENGTKELFIEVAVSHFCEPKKVERIRERKVAAIEIDLSKVPRNGSPEEMEQAIITAPRKWLFNARQEDAIERLRAESERKAAEFERKAAKDREREQQTRQQQQAKLDAQADRLAEAFRTIRTVPPGPGSPTDQDLVELVLDTSLRDLVDIEVPGNACFAVAARIWQVAILNWLILDQSSRLSDFESEDVLKRLRQRGLVRPTFAMHIGVELAAAVRIREADFNSPWESVHAYLNHLAVQRKITPKYGRWHRNEHAAKEAQNLIRDRADGRGRVTRLEGQIMTLGGERGLDVEQWMGTQHSGLAGSPAALAMAGGWNYDKLDNHLMRLEYMRVPGAQLEENLLGLPLEKEQKARREEQRLAKEKAQREREEAARKADDETRQANAGRRQLLIDQLIASAGESEVDGWMDQRLESLGGASIKDLEGLSEDQEQAAYRELMDERERRNAERRQKAIINELQENLREEARRLRGPEWADVWMRALNSVLKNQRPATCASTKQGSKSVVKRSRKRILESVEGKRYRRKLCRYQQFGTVNTVAACARPKRSQLELRRQRTPRVPHDDCGTISQRQDRYLGLRRQGPTAHQFPRKTNPKRR